MNMLRICKNIPVYIYIYIYVWYMQFNAVKMHKNMYENVESCMKHVCNLQLHLHTCKQYAQICIGIYAQIGTNMHKYVEYMQVYARPEKSALLWTYARNTQDSATRNMQVYAKYAIKNCTCSICKNMHPLLCWWLQRSLLTLSPAEPGIPVPAPW